MFKLTIKNNKDNSIYWTEHFNSIEKANEWLEEEKTRPYYLKSFSSLIEDLTPPVYVPSYKEKRAAEYPLVQDYLDGIVKSHSDFFAVQDEGNKQVEKYIADCIAVKAKYPKPE